MIDELRAMAIFAETIKQGSFRKAATTLKLSPSVVSYQITQLEEKLGAALIYRSTRSLSLTNEGKSLYSHCSAMLEAANSGLNELSQNKQALTGHLSITLPSALIKAPISRKIVEFSCLHPELKLNVDYSDETHDVIDKGIDLAFRAGQLSDSSLKAKRVGQVRRKLVCSPKYPNFNHKLTSIDELEKWQWIKLDMLPNHRTVQDKNGEQFIINFQNRIEVNNVEAMTEFCLHGAGIATPPDFLVDKHLQSGELVELMSNWQVDDIPIYAIWPNNAGASSASKRLIEYVTHHS